MIEAHREIILPELLQLYVLIISSRDLWGIVHACLSVLESISCCSMRWSRRDGELVALYTRVHFAGLSSFEFALEKGRYIDGVFDLL